MAAARRHVASRQWRKYTMALQAKTTVQRGQSRGLGGVVRVTRNSRVLRGQHGACHATWSRSRHSSLAGAGSSTRGWPSRHSSRTGGWLRMFGEAPEYRSTIAKDKRRKILRRWSDQNRALEMREAE